MTRPTTAPPEQRLHDALEAALAKLPPGPLLVALSGGLDSSVLLRALAETGSVRTRGLRAIHVDHGLQDSSADWAEHCRRLCLDLNVPLSVVRVDVERGGAEGPEGVARRARYAAFTRALRESEILTLAHHRGDQAETVLLKLLRGAGPEGLGAMRTLRPFASGAIWRPLLGLPHALLRACAEAWGAQWVDDPSNFDTSFDRNYVRHDILPRLIHRWPEAESSIAQSATWSRAAAAFIDEEATAALAQVQGLDPRTLDFGRWLALPEALRDPVLRQWLRDIGLPGPTHFQASELVRQLAEAGEDRQPCVSWPGTEVRRYRGLLHALAPLPAMPGGWQAMFSGAPVELPGGAGTLALVSRQAGGRQPHLSTPLLVTFRRGGESMRPTGENHVRELRELFQSAGITPWWRGRLPLLIDRHGHLLAVADLWQSDDGAALLAAANARIDWRPADTAH